MEKNLMALFAVCFLPAIVTARFAGEPFTVQGCVYCDTCRCGYENEATQYMPNAVVKVECRNKDTGELTFTKEAVTNATGHYTMVVYGDRGDDCCDAVLVRSSDPLCSEPNKGRDRARVILTRNNGMTSNFRYANAMGFLKNSPLDNCPQILQKYQLTEDEMY